MSDFISKRLLIETASSLTQIDDTKSGYMKATFNYSSINNNPNEIENYVA